MSLTPEDHLNLNFQTLRRACVDGQAQLLAFRLSETGRHLPVICPRNPHADGSCTLIPFAVLLSGDLWQVLVPETATAPDLVASDDL